MLKSNEWATIEIIKQKDLTSQGVRRRRKESLTLTIHKPFRLMCQGLLAHLKCF